jgi:hypothetical protein
MAGACVYKTISYALGVIDRISDGHKAAANRIPLRLLVHCNQRGVRMPMDVQAACERFDMTLVSLLDMNEILREDLSQHRLCTPPNLWERRCDDSTCPR